jgi:hypothetical protein
LSFEPDRQTRISKPIGESPFGAAKTKARFFKSVLTSVANAVFDQILVGAIKLLEFSLLPITFIDGLERSHSQQSCESFSVIVIRLVAVADRLVAARITDYHFGNQRLDELIQPGRLSAFFDGYFDCAAQTAREIRGTFDFGFNLGAALDLPQGIQAEGFHFLKPGAVR